VSSGSASEVFPADAGRGGRIPTNASSQSDSLLPVGPSNARSVTESAVHLLGRRGPGGSKARPSSRCCGTALRRVSGGFRAGTPEGRIVSTPQRVHAKGGGPGVDMRKRRPGAHLMCLPSAANGQPSDEPVGGPGGGCTCCSRSSWCGSHFRSRWASSSVGFSGPIRDGGPSIPKSGWRPVQARNRVGQPDAVEKHRTPTREVGARRSKDFRPRRAPSRRDASLVSAGSVVALPPTSRRRRRARPGPTIPPS
jgi:hypothetical protein